MKSKYIKLIVSLALILSLCFSLTGSTAYADNSFNQFKAFLASALTALNITIQSTNAPYKDALEYLVDPYNVVYTYPESQVDQFMDRSVIQIWDNYVTIDGVQYTDIWLSHDAAEKFRVNAYDVKSAYNLVSESQGEFATGTGYFDGVPIYQHGTNIYSQYYTFPQGTGTYGVGNMTVQSAMNGPYQNQQLKTTYSDGTQTGFIGGYQNNYWRIYHNPSQWVNEVKSSTSGGYTSSAPAPSTLYVSSPFDFDWVSGVIPVDTPLSNDEGLMIRVPSDTPGVQQFITDNPEFGNNNPVVIDVNLDPDINAKISDLMDLIIPIIPIINAGDINFTTNHTGPSPTTDTLLPDTWFSRVQREFDRVIETIQNIPTPDFSTIIQSISTIPQAITQAVSNITQAITNLGDSILQDIEEGPIRIFDKVLDILKTIFLPILTTLKGFLGIWHYVVSWISNISTPFTWTLNMMAGTSTIIMSPIYAAIAGTIVIAVYKRFGK